MLFFSPSCTIILYTTLLKLCDLNGVYCHLFLCFLIIDFDPAWSYLQAGKKCLHFCLNKKVKYLWGSYRINPNDFFFFFTLMTFNFMIMWSAIIWEHFKHYWFAFPAHDSLSYNSESRAQLVRRAIARSLNFVHL